jgi:hypothetical protein
MQVKALIASLTTLGFGVLVGCGSNSPAEVVIEPGITAIRESNALACRSDLGNLQLAIEAYTTLNVNPPVAESDLVPDWLRAESELYDLVGGQIVPAAGSDCPAPSSDTDGVAPEPAVAPETVSGCLAFYKTLQVAIEAYYAKNGVGTVATEQALVDAGLVRGHINGYDVDAAGQVVAVPGDVCDGVDVPSTPTTSSTFGQDSVECDQQRTLLQIALDAYLAANGSVPATEGDLVPKWLRREVGEYDLVDGAIVPAPASICPPI